MPTGIETTIAEGLMNSFGGPAGVGIIVILFFVGLATLIKSSVEGKVLIIMCGLFIAMMFPPFDSLFYIFVILVGGILVVVSARFLNK